VKVEQTAAVPAGTKVNVSALVDDNRYRYSNAGQASILPPPYPVVYNIRDAKVYIDQMPWEAGAEGKPLELGTSDQAKSDFPDATKRAFGQIDTTGLAPGRHMVYVQGTNSDGKPGAVSAAFLDVAEAKSGGGGGAVGGLAAALAGLAAVALQRRRKQAAASSL
jgi:MYXO-CTERM domain-containing protein